MWNWEVQSLQRSKDSHLWMNMLQRTPSSSIPPRNLDLLRRPTQSKGFCDEFCNNSIKWLLDVICILNLLADTAVETSRKEKRKMLTEIDFLLFISAFLFSTKHRHSAEIKENKMRKGTIDWRSDPPRQVLSQSPSSHVILANNQHIFVLNRCVLPCKG